MKRFLTALIGIFFISAVNAQIADPVSWKFSSKKISDKVYEITLSASVQPGWHIYSQTQPKDAIAIPTSFKFTNNPLVTFSGSVQENGKMEKFHDASINVSANQYSGAVSFTQKVTLKANAKTAVKGTVQYQTCDDKQCLPPKKVPFSIDLG